MLEGLSIPYGQLVETDGFIAIQLPAELRYLRPVNDSLLGAIVPICTWGTWASPWATVQVPWPNPMENVDFEVFTAPSILQAQFAPAGAGMRSKVYVCVAGEIVYSVKLYVPLTALNSQ